MAILHNPTPTTSQIDKPVYWADLVSSCLTGEGPKLKWVGTVWQSNLHSIDLLDQLRRSGRALSSNSSKELADGYLFKLMNRYVDTPLLAMQTAQLFSVIWQECYRQGVVEDDDLSRALKQWSKKLRERMVFTNWLLSWPSDTLAQYQTPLNEAIVTGTALGTQFFTKEQQSDCWLAFKGLQTDLALKFHERGLADFKKYTLDMNQNRFFKTIPIKTNIGELRHRWIPIERAKKLNDLKRNARQSALQTSPTRSNIFIGD